MREYLDENDILTMEWPAQSPDLNIIENIWLSIKRKLHSETSEIKSEEHLIKRFRHAWNEVTQLELDNLYASSSFPLQRRYFYEGTHVQIVAFNVNCLYY